MPTALSAGLRPILLFSVIAAFGTGCASGGATQRAAPGAIPEPVAGDQPFATPAGEATYHTLAAELAIQREDYPTAAEQYRLAAELSDDPELAGRAAGVAFELDQREHALAAAKRWAHLSPGNEQAHRYLASLYIDSGDVGKAVDSLRIVLDALSDDRGQAFLALTNMLMEEDRLDVARRSLSALVDDHPDVAEAQYGLGMLALGSGDIEVAREAAARAAELSEDTMQARLLLARVLVTAGDADEGLALASEVVDETPEPQARLEYAVLLAAVGRDDDARIELDALLLDEPTMIGALRTAGLVALRQDDLDGAEVYFNALLATNRRSYEAVYYLAGIAEEREDHARAAALYSQVRVGEHVVAAQVGAARSLLAMEGQDRAMEYLDAFAASHPRYAVEMFAAKARFLEEAGEADAALAVYADALEQFPGNSALLYGRAFLYESIDRVDDAIRELRAILETDPKDPVALNALGYTLADRTDRTREAYRYIKKALALAPDNAAIVDSMGWVQYKRGRLSSARDHLERAYSMAQDPEIAAHLGEVLWVMGETVEARRVWDEALVENPESEVLIDTINRFDP